MTTCDGLVSPKVSYYSRISLCCSTIYNVTVDDILPQIRIGHSALFRTTEGLRAWLSRSHEPLELVFPAREDEYLPLLGQLDDIAECAAGYVPGILSLHAPPLVMEADGFVTDALALARLAERIGAGSVTLHPSKCRRGDGLSALQRTAVENIRRAQGETLVTLAVETLGHRRCLLNEDEIAASGLPMVLDTTHVGWDRSIRILGGYGRSIRTIHLSERTDESHHQPIGKASFDFVSLLSRTGWTGSLILEYWPWRWRSYAQDVPRLRSAVDRIAATRREN